MSLKTLALILPGALILGTAGVALLLVADAPVMLQAARGYPYAAIAVALLLAWRLHRSRLFIGALSLGLVQIVLTPWALGKSDLVIALFLLFLPLGLGLTLLMSDRSIMAPRTRLQLGLAFAPLLIAAAVAAVIPTRARELVNYELLAPVLTSWSGLPQPILFALLLALTITVLVAVRSRRAPEAGMVWLTLAVILSLTSTTGSTARSIWTLAGALVLIVALVESSHILAFHDELTGLPGRRALGQMLGALRPPYGVAVIDVDHFKTFNDRHGHDVGDQVLRMVAAKIAGVGGGGRAFRSGGEEFTIVFPGATKGEVLLYAEAVRAAVFESSFTVRKTPRPKGKNASSLRGKSGNLQQRLRVTISIGVAAATGADDGAQTVLKSADKAMYRAKHTGRNRVVA